MGKKRTKVLIYCVIICVVFISGCYGYSKVINNKTSVVFKNDKKVSAEKVNMDVSIKETGSIYASVSKDIVPNNNGKIKDLNAKVGDIVQSGTKLFVSDNEEIIKNMKDAQENLDKQKSNLENDTKNYKDLLVRINASINDANTALSNVYNQRNKMPVISSINEELLKAINEIQGNLDKQNSSLENDIKMYSDLLTKINSGIENVETVLNKLYDELNKILVKSPVDGVVIAVKHNNGDSIRENNFEKDRDVILTILDRNNSNKELQIAANYDGVLNNLNLKVGDSVKAGEMLFTIGNDIFIQSIQRAQANLEKQKSALEELKNSKYLELDKLNISDAEIQLNSAMDAMNKMTITAPITGLITAVNNKNGDNVSAINTIWTSNPGIGQPTKPALTIVDPDTMKVKVPVDELDIERIKEGQKTEIRVDAVSGKVYEGTVESIPEIGITINGVTTYNVVVSIQNREDIKIGMSANVDIVVDSKDDVLAVPADVVIEKDNKRYVKNENDNLIEVKTGIENENYIEILDGIKEGEEVLRA
jgi:HlyD family secretion protein